MKRLYRFLWDCGRDGAVEGVFIEYEDVIEEHLGYGVYFGEILGKHSEIYGTLGKEDLTLLSDDKDLIEKLEKIFGRTICGYNPMVCLNKNYSD